VKSPNGMFNILAVNIQVGYQAQMVGWVDEDSFGP
jgi:hypothetical protein